MSKAYVIDRSSGNTLKPLENDSVVTVYDSIDDAELDLANIEEGQIVGTNDNVGSETIENAIKADLDEYAENLMQSYGQAVGSYLTMEDNSAIPQGYLLADGRDTTGTDDELLTKYPLLYAYLGNTNVLPYTPNTSIIGKDPDWFVTNTDSYPGSATVISTGVTYMPDLFPTEMEYDGFMQIHLDDWCYIHITHADGTHETYSIRRDDSWSDQVIYLKKGDKIIVNRTVGDYENWYAIQFAYVKIWYYKTLQYIKAVSGIETASTEASEVVNAITNATSLLEQDIQDNIGTYATDAVNAIVNDKTTLAEAANTYTHAMLPNTQFTDSLLNYEEIWFYARRSNSATDAYLPVMKFTHEQIVDCLTNTGSYSIMIPGYGSEYRQVKFNSTADVVTAVAGSECVYKVIGYRKRS